MQQQDRRDLITDALEALGLVLVAVGLGLLVAVDPWRTGAGVAVVGAVVLAGSLLVSFLESRGGDGS